MIQLFRPYVTEEAILAAQAVLRSGWIGMGPKTAEFEERFAEYVGARHAVALSSATAALHLALVVAGIGPGDEVLTTSLTFVSTNAAILYQQARPVFVDVDERTLNMDPRQAEALITPRTRALMCVHYGGNPADLDSLYHLAARHNLLVIEDAAHACGARYRGRRIGGFGLTCFSFQAVKNLPIGDGGMITTNDTSLYRRLERLRRMGLSRSTLDRHADGYQWDYDMTELGYKYNMTDADAAIGLAHLPYLDAWNARRREIAEKYRARLAPLKGLGLRFVEDTPGAETAQHLFAIRVPHRDAVVDALQEREIGVGAHYRPNHFYAPFAGARRGDLHRTEAAFRELISLPLHLFLTDGDVDTVCNALTEILCILQERTDGSG